MQPVKMVNADSETHTRKQRYSHLCLRIDVGALLQQQLHDSQMTASSSPVQRSYAVL